MKTTLEFFQKLLLESKCKKLKIENVQK